MGVEAAVGLWICSRRFWGDGEMRNCQKRPTASQRDESERRERDGAFVKGKDGGEGIFHVAFG